MTFMCVISKCFDIVYCSVQLLIKLIVYIMYTFFLSPYILFISVVNIVCSWSCDIIVTSLSLLKFGWALDCTPF
ncbi:hypothetical protein MAR_035972 [Mya arenaria]|uniref:Uncharacterized protein n=1 Tax=Mya arenaria TaxID=6604 RepID=A0ABY7EQ92_MYAAR|nr:hypothetical protein MAR_035972 [Mya arenaria]